MMKGKKIVLGVTGSIAAYKAVHLLRLFIKAGAEVRVVSTSGMEHFVAPLSFATLSGKPVFTDLWAENWTEHVALGTWADLMVVAPATANSIGKFANGLADNALTAVYLAASCPVMVAPAMDADMYLHPRVTANLQTLKDDGVEVLPVGEGYLASGLMGLGRMAEPDEIFEHASALLTEKILLKKRVLITAGPTQEALDPVRFLSNHSSGKMGYALARIAANMGAEVTLVTGPTVLTPPRVHKVVEIQNAGEMHDAVVGEASGQDIIIKAAAVADYRPSDVSGHKLKKGKMSDRLALDRTEDILWELGNSKPAGQLLVGFAMETENPLENAMAKLRGKNLDLIVLNSLVEEGAGFGHDTNRVTLIDRNERVQELPLMSKHEVAARILQRISGMYPEDRTKKTAKAK